MGTFREALVYTLEFRWRGQRSEDINRLFANNLVRFFEARHRADIDDLTTDDVAAYVRHRRATGDSPSTIQRRLSVLSVLADEAIRHRPPLATRRPPHVTVQVVKGLKWWLRPEDRERLVPWLKAQGGTMSVLGRYIDFTCETGLRVEEALRLRPEHFTGVTSDKPRLTVPGTKRKASQAGIPISRRAAVIAVECMALDPSGGLLFPVSYPMMARIWRDRCKPYLGVPRTSRTATLRAIRRSFAKVATDKGMPTEVLQKILRHEKIVTTVGYLQLVGASDLEGARDWLD